MGIYLTCALHATPNFYLNAFSTVNILPTNQFSNWQIILSEDTTHLQMNYFFNSTNTISQLE